MNKQGRMCTHKNAFFIHMTFREVTLLLLLINVVYDMSMYKSIREKIIP